MSRRRGEFPRYVKETARQTQETCFFCGEPEYDDDPFQVHHVIHIASEVGKQLPLHIIKSLPNAKVAHESCHQDYHAEYKQPPEENVDLVLNSVSIQKSFLR